MNKCEYKKLSDEEEGLPPSSSPSYSPRKERSYLKLSLRILSYTVALFLLLSTIAGTWGYFSMRKQVIRFTVTTPTDLPIDVFSEAELEVVKDRSKLFYDTLRAGDVPAEDLTVTAQEINAFIAHSDFMRGNAYVTLSDSKISAELSLPAEGMPGGKGRFFVASGFVGIELDREIITTQFDTLTKVKDLDGGFLSGEIKTFFDDNGEWVMNLQSGKFLNWIAPEDFIEEERNLLDDLDDCPEKARVLSMIEGVTVENGKITIKARRSEGISNVPLPKTTKASSKWNMGGVRRVLLSKLSF